MLTSKVNPVAARETSLWVMPGGAVFLETSVGRVCIHAEDQFKIGDVIAVYERWKWAPFYGSVTITTS